MADDTIKQSILEYLNSEYGLTGAEAQAVVDKIGNTSNSTRFTWDAIRSDYALDNTLGSGGKEWVDQTAADLGVPKKGATPQEQQANDQAAAITQGQATVQDTSKAIQAAAQNPATTPQDLASIVLSTTGQKQPPVIYQTFGRSVTDTELQQAVTLYNQANPTDQIDPTNTAEFLNRIQYGVPEAMSALGQSVEGADVGRVHFNVWDPKSQKMASQTIDRANIDLASGAFPADMIGSLGNVVGSAYRTNGEVPWQLLLTATKLVKGDSTAGASEGAPVVGKSGHTGFGAVGGFVPHVLTGPAADIARTARATVQDGLAKVLQFNLRKFNDPTLALIAIKDPQLAQAIYDNGGSTTDQAQKAEQILLDAGYDPTSMAKMGLAVDPKKFAAIVGTGAGGGGATVNLPDPATLRSGATTMYRAWFQREPTEDELQAFVGAIDSQVISTQKAVSNPFKPAPAVGVTTQQTTDPQSQIEQTLRSSPEYSQLFSQKPIGVSETDYANQFKSAGSRLLGGELANPDAVRLGMETGNTEDTLRYLFGQELTKGDQDQNSTFNQRVAQAAQAIAQVT